MQGSMWQAIGDSINGGINATANMVGALGGLGVGIAQTVLNDNIAKENLDFQKDVYNYQKQLQREIFQREDNAIRRRAADIAAAGGNPATAWEQNTGAGAGSPVSVTAPHRDYYDMSLIQSSLVQLQEAGRQFRQNRIDDATIRNLDAQTGKTNTETATEILRQLQIQADTARTEKERDYIEQQIKSLEHDLFLSAEQGLRLNDYKNTLYNSGDAMLHSILPDFDNDSSMFKYIAEIGLWAIPGFAGAKIAGSGAKALYKLFRNRGLPKTGEEFIKYYKKATGSIPSAKQIKDFNRFKSDPEGFKAWQDNMFNKARMQLERQKFYRR